MVYKWYISCHLGDGLVATYRSHLCFYGNQKTSIDITPDSTNSPEKKCWLKNNPFLLSIGLFFFVAKSLPSKKKRQDGFGRLVSEVGLAIQRTSHTLFSAASHPTFGGHPKEDFVAPCLGGGVSGVWLG